MKRVHVVVTGKVQDVWFRASTEEVAKRLGVAGWVRNAPDGSVEAAFEGPEDAVDELVAWCRRGPRDARVDAVETQEEAVQGASGFRVL